MAKAYFTIKVKDIKDYFWIAAICVLIKRADLISVFLSSLLLNHLLKSWNILPPKVRLLP